MDLLYLLISLGVLLYVVGAATQKKSKRRPAPAAKPTRSATRRGKKPVTTAGSTPISKSSAPAAAAQKKQPAAKPSPPVTITASLPAGIKPGRVVWIPMGQEVKIGPFQIPGGLIYVGSPEKGRMPPAGRYIDPQLPIATVSSTPGRMGYYPDYRSINPEQRRVYLQWLEAGRSFSGIDIGYIFLFYYGLEQRILDGCPAAEQLAIMREVARLRAIYSKNAAFNRYSTAFLDGLNARSLAVDTQLAKSYKPSVEMADASEILSTLAATARCLTDHVKLDFTKAVSAALILISQSEVPGGFAEVVRTPLFREFALEMFLNRYPQGYQPPRISEKKLTLFYRTAMRGPIDLVAGANSLPFDCQSFDWSELLLSLKHIYNRCLFYDIVDPLSKRAMMSIKSSLQAESEGIDAIDTASLALISAKCEPIGIIPFLQLAYFTIGENLNTLTMRAYRDVEETLARVSFAVATSLSGAAAERQADPDVAVFRVPSLAISQHYRAVAALLPFCLPFLQTLELESASLFERIFYLESSRAFALDEGDYLRLRALFMLARSNISAEPKNSSSKALRTIDAVDQETVIVILLRTIVRSGLLDHAFVKKVERLCGELKIPNSKLYSVIHGATAAPVEPASGPILVEAHEATSQSFAIPKQQTSVPAGGLDRSKIAAIQSETELVQETLGAAFLATERHDTS
jgi:hypothetical protein